MTPIVGREPRAVVIGYGFAGRAFHSYLIGLDSGLALHGVSSRNPETREKIKAERGCKAYESFEQVIEDPEVDLVVLATPHDTHADLSVRALDAGKHVVTDKVICTTLEECERMIGAAERNDRLLTVFHNRRWDGDYLTLKKLLDDGALGDLRWMELAWNTAGPPGGWRGQAAAGGGRLFDLGAHMLDQALTLLDVPVETAYCRMHHDYPGRDVESHAMAVLGFAGGATAVVDCGGMHKLKKPRFHAFGTEGAYRIHGLDPQEQAMKDGDIDAAREPADRDSVFSDEKEERAVPIERGRWRSFYENVADALAGKSEPAVTLPQMRRLMRVYDALHRSAREQTVARVEA